MQQNPSYPAQRLAGQEHIPLYPKGFVAVRILQLVLGVFVLGLTAYLLAVLTVSYPGDSLMIFTAVVNLIACIYYIVAAFGPKIIYNYWAILSLDIFMVVFWLISFALLASEAALVFAVINDVSNYYDSYDYSSVVYNTDIGLVTVYAGCMAGAAGLGALEFVLYIVSLGIHSVALHRHRAAGLHCTPVKSGAAPVAAQEKDGMTSTVTPAYQSGVPPFAVQQNAGYPMQMMPLPHQQQQQFYGGPPPQQQQQQQQQQLYSGSPPPHQQQLYSGSPPQQQQQQQPLYNVSPPQQQQQLYYGAAPYENRQPQSYTPPVAQQQASSPAQQYSATASHGEPSLIQPQHTGASYSPPSSVPGPELSAYPASPDVGPHQLSAAPALQQQQPEGLYGPPQ